MAAITLLKQWFPTLFAIGREAVDVWRQFYPMPLKPALPLANGSESKYSPEEITTFQGEFDVRVCRIRRIKRILQWIGFGLLLCLVADMFELLAEGMIFAVIAITLILILMTPKLICPGCHHRLDISVEEFCPACGHSGWIHWPRKFSWPRCSACESNLRGQKDARHYRIRACTHCGLPLDDEGV